MTSGAVACGNPDTAAAAVQVLRDGGNAVDAAVAAGFTAAVAEPGLTSCGGGGFLLYRDSGGRQHLLDFFVNAPGQGLAPSDLSPHFTPVNVNFPGADQVFHAGYGSVAVPGVLDGYLTAHRRFGQLPLPQVLAPARERAGTGVPLAPTQAQVLGLLREIFTLTPAATQTYTDAGTLPTEGMRLRNPKFADFLASLAGAGATGWRDVPELSALLDEMPRRQGLLTRQDIDSYEVIDRDPLTVQYRDSRLTSNPAPSFGGSIVVAALRELDRAGADPEPRQRVRALAHATEAAKDGGPRSSRGTTHISVVDADGALASMTTSNGSCSGVMVPGTGVQLNNMMGEADLHPEGFHATTPGIRIGSMMAPMILDLPDGTVVALGSGGSERIRSALTQVVTRLVHDSHPVRLQEAIDAPRVHFDGVAIQAEPHLPEEALRELAAEGPVNRWTRRDLYFGGVHGVTWHPDGTVTAAGDARRDGVGVVVPL